MFCSIAHNTCNRSHRFKKVFTGELYDKVIKKKDISEDEWEQLCIMKDSKVTKTQVTVKKLVKKALVLVFAHNMHRYDGHLILAYFNKRFKDCNVSCILNTIEKYMMFQIGNLHFYAVYKFFIRHASKELM